MFRGWHGADESSHTTYLCPRDPRTGFVSRPAVGLRNRLVTPAANQNAKPSGPAVFDWRPARYEKRYVIGQLTTRPPP